MKKLALILGTLGVLALVLAFSIPQLVTSQSQTEQAPTAQPSVDRMQLRMEIGLLRLINEMGLSRDQLASIKEMISDLRTSEQAILQAQQELRDFLASYNGTREGFAEAVKPFDEKIAQARKAFHEKLRTSIEKAKDRITMRQAEILREFITRHLGTEHLQPSQRMMTPAEPDHKLELRIDLQTPSKTELLERFKDHIEEWLDHFGINLDQQSIKQKRPEDRWEMAPSTRWGCELRERPMFFRRCETQGSMFLEGRGRYLLEHLDLLEKVLTEKLQQMSSTHI